jgi:hypothetical protein
VCSSDLEERGWVVHNTKRRLEAHAASDADANEIEARLLAFLQVATLLLRKNQVYRPDAALTPAAGAASMPGR